MRCDLRHRTRLCWTPSHVRPAAPPPDPTSYNAEWDRLAARGIDVHGEVALVEQLVTELATRDDPSPARVLDAGCGTGRVAIELARRGLTTVGVDLDPELLAAARATAPDLAWVEADLAALAPGCAPGPFDAVVLAGNVMIFVAPGTETAVLRNLAARLTPRGIVVAGFQLSPGGLGVTAYDECAAAAGLELVARWSTWDREPFRVRSTYQVSVHHPRGRSRSGSPSRAR